MPQRAGKEILLRISDSGHYARTSTLATGFYANCLLPRHGRPVVEHFAADAVLCGCVDVGKPATLYGYQGRAWQK